MEDAMVINKSSYERGLAAACIYKSEIIDLSTISKYSGIKHPVNRSADSEYFFDTIDPYYHSIFDNSDLRPL
ncbi:unnamed protein product [Protopolystoma xenopodis]|uniref:Uncharacterized protein n=1 Tax=Protopolystoma xenopodis TaxID=117903 RepID=A0A3S5B1K2_9PLAT|nr:unnamed protein product [Protopolystoma xenopodis]